MRTGKGRPLTPFRFPTHRPSGSINPNISGKEQPGQSWSRAKRETTGNWCGVRIDPSGVVYQIPESVNSVRDRCRGRKIGTFAFPVVARFARTTGYPT